MDVNAGKSAPPGTVRRWRRGALDQQRDRAKRFCVNDQDDVGAIRRAIDETDDAILQLIEKRLDLAGRMALLKNKAASHSPLRPRREAFILDRLKRRARRASATLVDVVWRELIGHGRQAQAPMKLVLSDSEEFPLLEECARRQFSSAIAVERAESREAALAAARDQPAIAALAGPADDPELTLLGPIRTSAGEVVGFAYARVADGADD